MMGLSVEDPDGVEGGISRLPGLELLPVSTVMLSEKVTRQTEFRFLDKDGDICKGYEIHMGQSSISAGCSSFELSAGWNSRRMESGREMFWYVYAWNIG